ncbi:MAG: ABC transporter permease [Chloroflexi bacterium]|nr:ABC transporter permease [Chloroflexota bacterium]
MIQYTIRRLLLSIPVLLAVLVITFFLARAIPGDPCKAILGEKATQETCEIFVRNHGLDKPKTTQFILFMGKLVQGDLGESIRFSRPVTIILVERLPMTIELGVSAMILAILLGVPAGIIAAVRRNSIADVLVMIGANTGISIPVFFLGLLLIYFFAITLKDTPFVLPPSGRLSAGMSPVPFYELWEWAVESELSFKFHLYEFIANHYIFNALITGDWELFWDALKHMILPAFALSTIPMSIIARMTRSSMLEVLGLDYIRTAKAKGLPQHLVVLKHGFRNALLPVVTIVGLQLGGILGGAVLTESIFGLAGVGRSVVEATFARDFPVLQGFVIMVAFIYVLFNLFVDLSYAFLDPRIRLE